MKDVITVQGKEYISVKRASEITKYSKDYIGQLCRAGKIISVMPVRTWWIDEASLVLHMKTSEEAIRSYAKKIALEASTVSVPAAGASVSAAIPEIISGTSAPVQVASTIASEMPLPVAIISKPALSYESDDRPLIPELRKSRGINEGVKVRESRGIEQVLPARFATPTLRSAVTSMKPRAYAKQIALVALVLGFTAGSVFAAMNSSSLLGSMQRARSATVATAHSMQTASAFASWWSATSGQVAVTIRHWLGIDGAPTELAVTSPFDSIPYSNGTIVKSSNPQKPLQRPTASTTPVAPVQVLVSALPPAPVSTPTPAPAPIPVKTQPTYVPTTITNTIYQTDPTLSDRIDQLQNDLDAFKLLQTRQSDIIAQSVGRTTSVVTSGGGGSGSVTSVDASGGTTGLSFTGGPVTSTGVLTLSGVLNPANGGTGTSTYSTGDILYGNNANGLSVLPASSNGLVLKMQAGVPTWAADLVGSGGAGAWATTSDNLAVYPSDTSQVVIIGSNATTSAGNILEVVGNSKFGGTTRTNNLIASALSLGSLNGPLQANNGVVSATTSVGVLYGGTGLASAPGLGNILVGNSNGGYTLTGTSSLGLPQFSDLGAYLTSAIAASTYLTQANAASTYLTQANAISTYLSQSSFNTLDKGFFFSTTSAQYFLAQNQGNAFSTTSAQNFLSLNQGNAFSSTSAFAFLTLNQGAAFSTSSASYFLAQNLGNAFSTTSVDFWKTQRDFFSTTSAQYFLAQNQGNAFSTTSASYFLGQNQGSAFSTTSADNYIDASSTIAHPAGGLAGNLIQWDGTKWISVATSTLGLTATGASSAYPFALSGNATSTLTQFNGGLTAYASSTIGDGTLGGGLTVNGGVTATGNAYFASTVGIGTTTPYAKLSVAGRGVFDQDVRANYFTSTSTSVASTFPYASTTALSASTLFATTLCLSTDCRTIWPTSGGTGGGTWSTTTSQVPNEAINYSNNGTDLVAIGGTSTTTAEFFFDPNAQQAYFSGSVGVGTNAPGAGLSVLSATTPQFRAAYDASDYFTMSELSTGDAQFAFNGANSGLLYTFSQPSITSSNFATNATTSFSVIGATGGDTSNNSTTVSGGRGGGVSLLAGIGGKDDVVGAHSEISGTGGVLTLGSGQGADATAAGGSGFNRIAGSGGDVTIFTGNGGAAANGDINTSGSGGSLILKGGNGGAATGGLVSVGGNGGSVSIFGGVAGTGASTNGSSGDVFLGSSNGSSALGNVYFGAKQAAFNTSTGFFGIGTTSPYAKLSVDGRGVFNQDVRANYFTATSTSIASTFTYASTTVLSASTLCLATDCRTAWPAGTAYPFALSGNATSTLTQFNGGLTAFASTTIGDGTQTGGLTVNGAATTTGTAYFAGNVGIGTSSPTFTNVGVGIEIAGGSPGIRLFNNAISNKDFEIYVNTLQANINQHSNAPLAFFTNSIQRMVISAAGNVGIGTTSPYAKLSVDGNGVFNQDVRADYFTATSTSQASTFAYASTTVLSASTLCLSTDCRTAWPAGYAFAGAGNSTSTLVQFNGGLTAYASTTIGNGTQIGGLTVSGGATTTGNVYFAGNVGIGTLSPASALDITASATSSPYITLRDTLGVASLEFREGTSSQNNTFIGVSAGQANTVGVSNTGIGYFALPANVDGTSNTATGYQSMLGNTSGSFNTAYGFDSLLANTTGSSNTAAGYESLFSNTSGSNNTANGNLALEFNTTGLQNTATGARALRFVSVGSFNTSDGYQSLTNLTLGQNNTAFGYQAGSNLTTASSSIIIGANVSAPSATLDGQLNIGNLIYGTGLYNANAISSTPAGGKVGIGTTTPWRTLSVNGSSDLGFNAWAGTFTATSTSLASTFTYASTTVLSASTLCLSTDCRTLWPTSLSYAFGLAGNATSTLTQFNGGLTAFASTTIGDGTLGGGLTVNGGATTTGSAYFAGNVGIGVANSNNLFQVHGGTNLNLIVKPGISDGTAMAILGLNDSGIIAIPLEFRASKTNFATGNVGIGTTTPYAKLSVDGRGVFNQDVRADYFTATSTTFASTFTYASTTVLSASTLCILTDCRTAWPTGGGSGSYDFALAGNATSTLTQFNGGLTALASSTIGNGTQGGGLTINGGATTTKAFYILPEADSLIIGTTTPTTLGSGFAIDVSGTGGQVGAAFDSSNASGFVNNQFTIGPIGSKKTGYVGMGAASNGSAGYTNRMFLESLDAGGVSLLADGSGDIRFYVGGASVANQKMVLSNSGNFGIGTTTPGSLLSVGNTNGINFSTATSTFSSTGGINLTSGCFAVNGVCITGGGGGSGTINSGTTNRLSYYSGATTLDSANFLSLNTSSGFFGIGTTTPWRALSVVGSSDLGNNALAGSFTATSSTATSTFAGDVQIGDLAAANAFTVDYSGNVGIGTSSPFAVLSVQGASAASAPLFAIATTTGVGQSFLIDHNGLMTINTPNATSTINGNLYVNGTLRGTNVYSGDLIFANGFRFTEADPNATSTPSGIDGLYLKNQNMDDLVSVDKKGNLTVTGDICSNGTQCYGTSISNLAANLQALASSSAQTSGSVQSALSGQSTTALSLSQLTVNLTTATQNISDLSSRVDSLASTTALIRSMLALATSTLASTTADQLATSTSFIQSIAFAVKDVLATAGDWVLEKITAKQAIFADVQTQTLEAQTASVSRGLEMTDQITGRTYCVTIKNGDFSRELGVCGVPATSTEPVVPVENNPVIIPPPTFDNPVSTSTAPVVPVTTDPATTTPSVVTTATSTPPTGETASSTPADPAITQPSDVPSTPPAVTDPVTATTASSSDTTTP